MINPISRYGSYSPFSINPISGISGFNSRTSALGTPTEDKEAKFVKNPTASKVKAAGRKSVSEKFKTE